MMGRAARFFGKPQGRRAGPALLPGAPARRKWAARLSGEADKTSKWPGPPDRTVVRAFYVQMNCSEPVTLGTTWYFYPVFLPGLYVPCNAG